ncbi:tRNA (guanine(10)-N2)-methyltransferase homolog isoform X2 [Aricia agestis]|uniref:tRNA (guanine(10)-N2)-methyltransferase homolog isoform X2 n=1 Tax=Aricia agestis TaxID=91739 RepID=UPI001C201970|nr:tRNA (guanine(10)-N2)-methyltransferase homolog isoform X2 [Aricia agestis]
MWRRYLMWFAHEHIDFRFQEIQSIIKLFDIPIRYVEKPCTNKPYWIVEVPSEEHVKLIASRSVLLKNCIELWSRAKTGARLHSNLKQALMNKSGKWIVGERSDKDSSELDICPGELISSCCSSDISYKVHVETFCNHFSMKEKVDKIEKFCYLPLNGSVNLKKPDITLAYIEFYGIDCNNVPEEPYDLFFGKWVADGQRDLIQAHSLKKRKFIGNTSMDAQLSLIMANQAQVSNGHIILDPFVGSGSLFIAAAHFGAYVWGSDIDYMMLHARTRPTRCGQKVRTKEENIRSNMKHYGSESKYLDVIVSDFSLPMWRSDLKFDAIVTDPPYGVREPTEKIGIERDNYSLSEEHLEHHVPSKVEYGLPQLYSDLLNFAARHLELHRRLICWYPVVRSDYSDEELPSHPCLELVANSEQVLSKLTARRLLTYEKIKDYTSDVHIDKSMVMPNFRFYFQGEIFCNGGNIASREKRKES